MNRQLFNIIGELETQVAALKEASGLVDWQTVRTFTYEGDLSYWKADNGRHRTCMDAPGFEFRQELIDMIMNDAIDAYLVRSHEGHNGVDFDLGKVRITVEFLKEPEAT